MNLTLEPAEGYLLVRVEESRFDALAAPDFKARLATALAGAAPRIVLDLSPVSFIDSAALAAILSVVKGLPPEGDLRLAGPREPVRAVLRLTRLDKVLAIYPTAEEASASFEGR